MAALQRQGKIVAVTACHSNEAALLEAADVGFARGSVATDVAKAAADVLLTDDSYVAMVQTIVDSEGIMDSRKYVLKQTGILAIGQAVCVAAMIGVFALLAACSAVILGIGFGCMIGTASLAYQAVLLTGLHLVLLALPTCLWAAVGVVHLLRQWCEKN